MRWFEGQNRLAKTNSLAAQYWFSQISYVGVPIRSGLTDGVDAPPQTALQCAKVVL